MTRAPSGCLNHAVSSYPGFGYRANDLGALVHERHRPGPRGSHESENLRDGCVELGGPPPWRSARFAAG